MKKGQGLKAGYCAYCGRMGLIDSRPNKVCACGEPWEPTDVRQVETSEDRRAAQDSSPSRGPQVAPLVAPPPALDEAPALGVAPADEADD